MLQECLDACLDPVRAADLLKLGGNLAVAEPGIIAAIAADQLVFHGVVGCPVTVSVAGRLPPQSERPFPLGPVIHRHVCLPRNGGLARPGGTWTRTRRFTGPVVAPPK